MRYYGDLHVHVGRAGNGRPVKITASRQLTVRRILAECIERKGIDAVGIVDCGSPYVLEDLLRLADEGCLAQQTGGGLLFEGKTLLMPASEIEVGCGGRGSAHFISYFPDLEAMGGWSRYLSKVLSNCTLSTQRAGISPGELLRQVRALDGELVIAHAFTPHKSVYGNCTDRLSRIYGDLSVLGGLELGLSSDTYLADRIGELATLGFLSNSDAHSPAKIAREYNVLELSELSHRAVFMALRGQGSERIARNCGLDPKLGKYHRTFCLSCDGIADTEPPVRICRRCGSSDITFGVLDRIVEIQDAHEPIHPSHRPEYRHQIPLEFIPGLGPRAMDRLISEFGSEMAVLDEADPEDLESAVGPRLAAAVIDARTGRLKLSAGGGGHYGKVLNEKGDPSV